MIVKRLIRVDISPRDLTLQLETETEGRVAATLPSEIVADVIARLADAANQLEEHRPQMTHGLVYPVDRCNAMQTDRGQWGIVVQTTDGSRIPLVLDASSRAALRACIDQIEHEAAQQKRTH